VQRGRQPESMPIRKGNELSASPACCAIPIVCTSMFCRDLKAAEILRRLRWSLTASYGGVCVVSL
jgi:hypothetical protein